MHAAGWRQTDWLESAEENQGYILVCPSIPFSTSGTQGAGEEEKWSRIPNIATAIDIKVSNWVIILQPFRPEWIGGHRADTILYTKQKTIRDIWYDIWYDIVYDINYRYSGSQILG